MSQSNHIELSKELRDTLSNRAPVTANIFMRLVMRHETSITKQPLSRLRIFAIAATLAAHIAVLLWVTAYIADNSITFSSLSDTNVPIEFVEPPRAIAMPTPADEQGKKIPKPAPAASARSEHRMADSATAFFQESTTPLTLPNDVQTATTALPGISSDSGNELNGTGNFGRGNAQGTGMGDIEISNLKPKHTPAASYPRASLKSQQQGVVILLVKVGADGLPLQASVIQSSGFQALDENAKRHIISRWRFYPALRNGIPVSTHVLAKQIYSLDSNH